MRVRVPSGSQHMSLLAVLGGKGRLGKVLREFRESVESEKNGF